MYRGRGWDPDFGLIHIDNVAYRLEDTFYSLKELQQRKKFLEKMNPKRDFRYRKIPAKSKFSKDIWNLYINKYEGHVAKKHSGRKK